eukprot:gb/GECG01007632.1/.p1 GENE.gb/GECG01007632.1/~~gb/GECG01007632.1/.p1  ORF type:complete len:478 (+),score=96.56 gb/GECG01007632.1/:1-1434(+)
MMRAIGIRLRRPRDLRRMSTEAAMASDTTRMERIQEAQRRLFGQLQPSVGSQDGERSPRTSRKLLKKHLRGHAYVDYVAAGPKEMKFRDYVDPDVDWHWEYKRYLDQMGDLKTKDKERDGFKPKWHRHKDVDRFNETLTHYKTDDEYPSDSDEDALLDDKEEAELRLKIQDLLDNMQLKEQEREEEEGAGQTSASQTVSAEEQEKLDNIRAHIQEYQRRAEMFSLTDAYNIDKQDDDPQANPSVINQPEKFTENVENVDAMKEMADDIRNGLQQLQNMGFDLGIRQNEDTLPSIDEEAVEKEVESDVAGIVEADDSANAETKASHEDESDDGNENRSVFNSRAYAAYDVLSTGLLAENMEVDNLLPHFRELLAMSTYESQHYSLLETDIESDDSEVERDTKGLKQSQVYGQRLATANWLYEGVQMCEEGKKEGTRRLQLFSNFLVSEEAEKCWKAEKNILDAYANHVALKFAQGETS